MKDLYLSCLFLIAGCPLIAQALPSDCPVFPLPPPAAFCAEACTVFDLDGYQGYNQPYPQWDVPPQFCAPVFHNINWVAFTTSFPWLELRINVNNCLMNLGLQVGLFETTDCNSFYQVSNCEPSFYPEIHLSANNLLPGRTYYLVIDGNEGDLCDFEVFVEAGQAYAPAVDADTVIIEGPDSLCAQGVAFFNTQYIYGAGYHNWELDGVSIGQDQYVEVSGLAPGTYELCATPGNPTYGYLNTACKTITVYQTPPHVINEEVCIESLPFNLMGYAFGAPGTYNFTRRIANQCEQEVVLNLSVFDANPTTRIDTSVCYGETISLGGYVLSQPGYYPLAFTDQNGCDSLVEATLFWIPTTITNVGTVAAELPYLLGGTAAIDTAGNFIVALTGEYGCDSLVAGFLAAIGPDTLFIDTTICRGDTVFYNMDTLTASGVYLDTLISGDSAAIEQLTLTVLPVSETFLNEQVCEGEPYYIGGQVLTAPGVYQAVFPNPQTGCDSIIYIELNVLPSPVTMLSASICEGDTYEFGGVEVSEAGDYTEVYTTSAGCDSVVALSLSVIPAVDIELDTTLCPGEVLYIGPYDFREPFEAELQFTSANGCDSIVNLDLTYYDTLRLDTVAIEPDDGDFFGGSILVGISGGNPPYSYLWDIGRTEPFIDLLPNGRYFLVVTDANGCTWSNYFKVPLGDEFSDDPSIGRPGYGNGGIKVSPNPFSREVEVQLSGIDEGREVRLLLYNIAGQLVHEKQVLGFRHRLCPQAPAGVYWLVAEQEGQRIGVERVVRIGR